MYERVKACGFALIFVAVIGISIFACIFQNESNQTAIKEWAASNRFTIVSCEQPWFDHGPFWFVDENDRIYKVVVRDHLEKQKTYYHRFRLWGHDIEWSQ